MIFSIFVRFLKFICSVQVRTSILNWGMVDGTVGASGGSGVGVSVSEEGWRERLMMLDLEVMKGQGKGVGSRWLNDLVFAGGPCCFFALFSFYCCVCAVLVFSHVQFSHISQLSGLLITLAIPNFDTIHSSLIIRLPSFVVVVYLFLFQSTSELSCV